MRAGITLAVAAALFWLAWLLMPGVGVTDPNEIFRLVSSQRSMVLASVLIQLVSAVLYVPALLGIASDAKLANITGVRFWSGVLLVGAMGSAADAVEHMLAYAMTAPTVDTAASIPVMQFMQGPGLAIIAPLILGYFVGVVGLSVLFYKARIVSLAVPGLNIAALIVGIVGGVLASRNLVSSRLVGLTVLGAISLAQVLIGLRVGRYEQAGSHDIN